MVMEILKTVGTKMVELATAAPTSQQQLKTYVDSDAAMKGNGVRNLEIGGDGSVSIKPKKGFCDGSDNVKADKLGAYLNEVAKFNNNTTMLEKIKALPAETILKVGPNQEAIRAGDITDMEKYQGEFYRAMSGVTKSKPSDTYSGNGLYVKVGMGMLTKPRTVLANNRPDGFPAANLVSTALINGDSVGGGGTVVVFAAGLRIKAAEKLIANAEIEAEYGQLKISSKDEYSVNPDERGTPSIKVLKLTAKGAAAYELIDKLSAFAELGVSWTLLWGSGEVECGAPEKCKMGSSSEAGAEASGVKNSLSLMAGVGIVYELFKRFEVGAVVSGDLASLELGQQQQSFNGEKVDFSLSGPGMRFLVFVRYTFDMPF